MTHWLVDIANSRTCEPVVYLIPHAGAGVGAVLPLGRVLADQLDVAAVRLPGRESLLEQAPITDLVTMADGIADRIPRHAGTRPVVLFGHSSGAVLAYETARRLSAERVVLLVVSAQQAPGTAPSTSAEVWTLPDDEFFAQVARDGYLPAELLAEPELLDMVGPALRADYRAVDRHLRSLPHPLPVSMPIIAVHAEHDDTVHRSDVAAWAGLSTDGGQLEVLPGGHNLLRDDPAGLAGVIREGIGRIMRAPSDLARP